MVRRMTSALVAAAAIMVLAGGPVGAREPMDASVSAVVVTPEATKAPDRSVGSLDQALAEDLRRFGWPLLLGAAVVAFLGVQSRSERHERKLADAPLDQGERLRFK